VTRISRSNLLGSCEEKLTFNKLFIERAKGLTKILTLKGKSTVILSQQSREPKTTSDKNNLKAVFRLLALFVYIQLYLYRRLSCNHNSSLKLYRFPIFAGFVEEKSLQTCCIEDVR